MFRMSDSSDGKQRVARLLVLVSCSLANLVVMGYGQGLAVVYVQVTDVFSSTRAVTSLLQSLCFGVTFLGGEYVDFSHTRVGDSR